MIARPVLCLVAAAGVASAEPAPPPAPDLRPPPPAVTDAADANLESIERRHGMTFTIAGGPSIVAGFGIAGATGRAVSAFSLRLGRVANPRTVATLELAAAVRLHRAGTMDDTSVDLNTHLLAGAQYYVNPSLWVRGGGGLGVWFGQQVPLPSGALGERTLVGPAATGGAGVDLLRFKWLVISFEIDASVMATSDGALIGFNGNFGFSFD